MRRFFGVYCIGSFMYSLSASYMSFSLSIVSHSPTSVGGSAECQVRMPRERTINTSWDGSKMQMRNLRCIHTELGLETKYSLPYKIKYNITSRATKCILHSYEDSSVSGAIQDENHRHLKQGEEHLEDVPEHGSAPDGEHPLLHVGVKRLCVIDFREWFRRNTFVEELA